MMEKALIYKNTYDTKKEKLLRDSRIYGDILAGFSPQQVSDKYSLTLVTIKRTLKTYMDYVNHMAELTPEDLKIVQLKHLIEVGIPLRITAICEPENLANIKVWLSLNRQLSELGGTMGKDALDAAITVDLNGITNFVDEVDAMMSEE